MSAVHRCLVTVSRIEADRAVPEDKLARDWQPALGRALIRNALNCPMRDSIPILKRLLASERLRLTIRKQILRALVFIPSSEVGPLRMPGNHWLKRSLATCMSIWCAERSGTTAAMIMKLDCI